MGVVKGLPWLMLLLAGIAPVHAAAEDTYHALAGAEVDTREQSFFYAGAGAARPIGEGLSATGQVFTGRLKYSFTSDGRTLKAEMPMVNVSAGLKLDRRAYTLAGSVGVDLRRPERELAAGGTETGSEAGASVQVEAYLWGGNGKSLAFILSYSTIDDFFWARARGKKGVYEGEARLYAGAELIAMGNSDFSATQAGLFIELATAGDLSVLVKAGVKDSSAYNTGGYAGIEFFKSF